MIAAAALLAYAAAYLRRTRTLARLGRPVPAARIACFLAGLAVVGAAISPPVQRAAADTMAAHMLEHLVLADLASLLLVLGLTGPVLGPLLRLRPARALRFVAHPAVALPLWAANLWLWHLPAAYQGALRHDLLHGVQHASFLCFGALLWMPLFGPFPRPAWFGTGAQAAYVLAVRLTMALLANLFVWSGTGFYAWYGRDLGDQAAAGAVMMCEDSVFMVALFAWLAVRWLRDAEERQQLAELSVRLGLAVDERRIARAVAAGRGDALRHTLAAAATAPARTTGRTDAVCHPTAPVDAAREPRTVQRHGSR